MANLDDLNKGNFSDVGMTGNAIGTMTGTWDTDQAWWRENFRNRPYVTADRRFEDYEPGYRFAYQSQSRYRGKNFNEVEPSLRSDWNNYEGRGTSTWDHVKESVRDAWDHLTGKR